MPKIKSVWIRLPKRGEPELKFQYDVNVNSNGIFSTTLPKDIVHKFQEANIQLAHNRQRREGYVEAGGLQELEVNIENLCLDLLSKKLTKEAIVLRYTIQTTCSYCIDRNGEIVPNGTYVDDKDGNYWRQGTLIQHATERRPFGMLIYVEAFWRREFQYRSGAEKTVYESLRHSREEELDDRPNLKWLCGISSMSKTDEGEVQEIEYDEIIAAFFVDMIKSICRLNERVKESIHPESIKALAENRIKLIG